MKKRLGILGLLLIVSQWCFALGGPPPQSRKPDVLFSDPPLNLQKDFKLTAPADKEIITNSAVKVSGLNQLGTVVFLDTTLLPLSTDNQFQTLVPMGQFGKKRLIVTFFTADRTPVSIKRDLLYLDSPNGFSSIAPNDQKTVLLFYNTSFFPKPNNSSYKISVANQATRADLAYFVAQINKDVIPAQKTPTPNPRQVFPDVSTDYWALPYIDKAVQIQAMSAFPDGTFKPDQPITQMEFVITIVRTMQWKVPATVSTLPFQNIPVTSWKAKYLSTALTKGMITAAPSFDEDQPMTFANFAAFASRLAVVQTEIQKLADFSTGFDTPTQWKTVQTAMQAYAANKTLPITAARTTTPQAPVAPATPSQTPAVLTVVSPANNWITFDSQAMVAGSIQPAQSVFINKTAIPGNGTGAFTYSVQLTPGLNTIDISAGGKTLQRNVIVLTSFQDLKGHWLENTAAKLRYAGLVADTPAFDPDQVFTRAQFAQFIVRAFGLKAKDTNPITITDVPAVSPDLAAIQIAAQYKILTPDASGRFFPNRTVSNAQAIAVILRAANLTETDIQKVKMPYKDVLKKSWAYTPILQAYQAGLISATPAFYPDKPVSKERVTAILIKTPVIQSKLKRAFQ